MNIFTTINNVKGMAVAASKLDQLISNQALEQAPMGIVLSDGNQQILWCNPTLGQQLGIAEKKLIGQNTEVLSAHLHPTEQPDIYRVNNQQNIWLKSVKCCIQDEQGQVLNSNYFIDVSETIDLSKQNQDLEAQLADNIPTDKLTGLLNRKSLLNALERQVSRSRRYSNPLSVIIVRLHHWQASHDDSAATINDALTAIAFDLRDQMRWVDLIGRTDDQEFTLILPETASDDASHLAEKIRKRLLDLSHPDKPEMQLKISLKAGVTSWRKGDDIRLLYARALEAAESAEQEENKNIITL